MSSIGVDPQLQFCFAQTNSRGNAEGKRGVSRFLDPDHSDLDSHFVGSSPLISDLWQSLALNFQAACRATLGFGVGDEGIQGVA